MSVFNGGPRLGATLGSVLGQADVDLELVVIDDGSTDGTAATLDEAVSRDSRVRVFHQRNTGLTRALARGCREAQAEFVARQDAGDVSLPGRLRKQLERLRAHTEEALVSCWTTVVGPGDEALFVQAPPDDPEANRRRLRVQDVSSVRSISHHGTAVFRRRDYERVGGYREQFYVAQDLDLWLRLTDQATIGVVPETLYQAQITPASLSARYRSQQFALATIGLELAVARERGEDEAPLLARAESVQRSPRPAPSRRELANGFYFIGKCLLDGGDTRCRKYLRAALRAYPLHLRAGAALASSAWRPRV